MTLPPRSQLTSYYGYPCDPDRPSREDTQMQAPAHQGCDGWWPLEGDPDGHTGWCCACPCHQTEMGWPGYDNRHRREPDA